MIPKNRSRFYAQGGTGEREPEEETWMFCHSSPLRISEKLGFGIGYTTALHSVLHPIPNRLPFGNDAI